MRRFRVEQFSVCSFIRATMIIASLGLGFVGQAVVAGEIESLLMRGLPTSLDPAAQIQQSRGSRLYPFSPMTRLPFYGLPYEFVDTTTGRLAFEVPDLALPGRVPIIIRHSLDTGMNGEVPLAPSGKPPRFGADLGQHWSISYSDYIQQVTGGYVLAKTDAGPIKFIPSASESATYVKERHFASNHMKLQIIPDVGGDTIDETRADGSGVPFPEILISELG